MKALVGTFNQVKARPSRGLFVSFFTLREGSLPALIAMCTRQHILGTDPGQRGAGDCNHANTGRYITGAGWMVLITNPGLFP